MAGLVVDEAAGAAALVGDPCGGISGNRTASVSCRRAHKPPEGGAGELT